MRNVLYGFLRGESFGVLVGLRAICLYCFKNF